MTSLFRVPQWTEDAACGPADVHPEWFFRDAAREQAKAVCDRCPVRNLCLAEFRDDKHAFAGGYSAAERKKMREEGLL